MLSSVMNFLQSALEFSMLGCVEVASVALIVYYVYAKTRAPAIIAGLFPNLNLGINYRSSLVKFNNMSNELLVQLRNSTKSQESKSKKRLSHGIGTRNMLEITPHAGRRPNLSVLDWGVYLPYFAQSLRSKKFGYPQVSSLVLQDPTLNIAIKQSAEQILREHRLANSVAKAATLAGEEQRFLTEILNNGNGCNSTTRSTANYQKILREQEFRASSIINDMRSTLNNFLLSLTSWLLYKLLPCFLSGVVTNTEQIEMLKAAASRTSGTPLIFLPLHRSHLDYIMVTFILANNDIRSPLVAAGNNLQIPVFGELLRGLGAFFIKRKIDPVVGKKDILYRAVLQLYLQHALKMGHNVEFFIEGGRTRTGKPCMPKGGILSVIVNAFMDGQIPDALLVPVSVNYERLVDGNFVCEQKGEKKVPESFGKALSGIMKALNSKYGLMRIDFNQPYSIRELVQSYNKIANKNEGSKACNPSARTLQHNQSTSSLYGTDVVCEEHRNLIDSISREVVYDCAAATSVMSTNALAFLLLTRFRKGATDTEIAKGLDELRDLVKRQKDLGFAGNSLHIVNYATDLLGPDLVTRTIGENKQIIIQPKQTIDSFIELAYYSNMLSPHFALQSILLTTFHNLLPPKINHNDNHPSKIGVARSKLIQTAVENCDVFRYEFILNKPTELLEAKLEICLDDIILNGFIKSQQDTLPTEEFRENRILNRNFVRSTSDDEDDGYDIDYPDMFLVEENIDKQRAICEILAPFSHTYTAVAQSLQVLYKNPMLESEFVKFVINDLTCQVHNGSCAYAESISTDSVRNCLKLLEKWSVIDICNQNGLRLLILGTLYENSKESIKNIVQRISAVLPDFNSGYF